MRRQAKPTRPERRRRLVSESRVSFLISVCLHAGLLLLLGIQGVRQVQSEVKLTEISYIEQRYGEQVAKKVTVAPEKVLDLAPERAEPPKREGSIFAKGKPTPELQELAATPLPAPKPKPVEAPSAFAKAPLQSRARRASVPGVKRVESEDVILSAGLTDSPQRTRMASEEVDLKGQVLVGRKSGATRSTLFEVDEGGPSLAGSALTLAAPTGGVANGHPDLVGGTLVEGKQAYRGNLPSGHLVDKGKGSGRVEALASIQIAGPGGEGTAGILGGGIAEPSRGKGLVSRGGRDAISRGSLRPRGEAPPRPADALTKVIAPPKQDEGEAEAPAEASSKQEADGVSMTLSGPILGREILASRPPDYPAQARRQGWQGAVSVYFTVRPDGSIKKVFVEKASPYQVLDQAAKRCLEHWRFEAAPEAAEQWGVLTIVFRLR